MTLWDATKAKVVEALGYEVLPLDQAMDELGVPGVWIYQLGRTAYVHVTHPTELTHRQANAWREEGRNHHINRRTGANLEGRV